jgi:hypothetical protein
VEHRFLRWHGWLGEHRLRRPLVTQRLSVNAINILRTVV